MILMESIDYAKNLATAWGSSLSMLAKKDTSTLRSNLGLWEEGLIYLERLRKA